LQYADAFASGEKSGALVIAQRTTLPSTRFESESGVLRKFTCDRNESARGEFANLVVLRVITPNPQRKRVGRISGENVKKRFPLASGTLGDRGKLDMQFNFDGSTPSFGFEGGNINDDL
jgi:hypothetical protein